jgi:integrase
MSVYLVQGKGWRYDFTMKGTRYTNAWFKTKKDALQAEARRKEEISNPEPIPIVTPQREEIANPEPIPMMTSKTDMGFLELVNRKLDHVKTYNTENHYRDFFYNARRWIKQWGHLTCREISKDMVQNFIHKRIKASKASKVPKKISACTANQDLRYLRSAFNYGKKMDLIDFNPTQGIEFLPTEKKSRYVPPSQDVDKMIDVADPDTQDYLWVLRETMARVGEINSLTWNDVHIEARYVELSTRKKKGGHLTPRKVPMTDKLFDVLSKRFKGRNKRKPWVFWHTYHSRKTGKVVSGPYENRKDIMWNLCKKAGVKYFSFHALRHAGASIMDNSNVPIGAIQKILGHENRSTTEIYLHSFGMAEREAISIYELARQKSHTESHIRAFAENEKRGQLSLTP